MMSFQNLFLLGIILEKGLMTELCYEFRQQHYLIGLVLCDLEAILQNTHSASLHSKVGPRALALLVVVVVLV